MIINGNLLTVIAAKMNSVFDAIYKRDYKLSGFFYACMFACNNIVTYSISFETG